MRSTRVCPACSAGGLCGDDACGEHIDTSVAERARLAERGINLDTPTADGSCPALARAFGPGHCRVHEIRPMVCRLWGLTQAMRCPHGCRPAHGHLPHADALRMHLESREIGGHPAATNGPEIRALLERCLADEHAAGLMARMLRGDQQAKALLAAHLTSARPSG